MDVYFDTWDLALAVTSATGSFTCTLTVPVSAAPGTHWITAVGRAAQKPLAIRTPWARFRKWTGTTGGSIFDSFPAVADGRLYIGSDDRAVHAYALDACSKGELLHSRALPGRCRPRPPS